MRKMKTITALCLSLGLVGLTQAGESIANPKTTATMQATCSIEVNPLGFGFVSTPLMSQSTQSEMSVKCSNASAYTIDLAYGGIYGEGNSGTGNSIEYTYAFLYENQYTIYDHAGVNQGAITCGFGGPYKGQVSLNTIAVATLYGYTTTGIHPDTKGACITNNTKSGTYPKNWIGAYNTPGKQEIGGKVGYAYGVMNGSFKGDKLAYSIAVPGDSNKVWNAGNNSYKSSGNGESQIIPVVAKIVPDKSGSKYPAPDMYLDTVTAVISY